MSLPHWENNSNRFLQTISIEQQDNNNLPFIWRQLLFGFISHTNIYIYRSLCECCGWIATKDSQKQCSKVYSYFLQVCHQHVIHPSTYSSFNHPPVRWAMRAFLLSVECLLHLPAQPCLVWGDLRGEIVNPNFEHESASRGKASWILSLFLMIMFESVWPEWWKCQPAYLSGTACRWYGRPVRKTRTSFWNREDTALVFSSYL